MSRFVVLSFVILAWVFYELSGGADFVPRGVRPPRPEPVATTPQRTAGTSAGTMAAQTDRPPLIAPRRTTSALTASEEPGMTAQARQTVRLEQMRAGLSRTLTAPTGGFETAADPVQPSATSGIELTSLAEGVTGLREAAPTTAETPEAATATDADPWTLGQSAPDYREITGLRVNMRNGPGTIYPVVGRLRIGDRVEVLDDSGTGWLRLRTDDRTIGWIATSLVSKKAP